MVTVEVKLRVLVKVRVLVESSEALPVRAPAVELPVDDGGGMPPDPAPLLVPAGTGVFVVVCMDSGQMVVETGTTDVTTEAEPLSGQFETVEPQL